MGFGGMSSMQIIIIIMVIAVLFGGKRLRSLGSDLGESLKGFKNAMKDDEAEQKNNQESNKL